MELIHLKRPRISVSIEHYSTLERWSSNVHYSLPNVSSLAPVLLP